jgi:NADH:ubiquinone oxidoreductase subunit E
MLPIEDSVALFGDWCSRRHDMKGAKVVKPFNTQTYQKLLEKSGGVTKESLFILLGKVQETFGYVPREVVRDLAARTGVAEARLYGALTSYRDFETRSEANG